MFHVSFWCLTHYIAFLSRFISDVFFCLSSILLAVSIELQFKLYYYQYEWQNWNKCVQSWTGFILFESFLLFLLNQGAATDCSRFNITIIKATSENGANFRLWQIAKKWRELVEQFRSIQVVLRNSKMRYAVLAFFRFVCYSTKPHWIFGRTIFDTAYYSLTHHKIFTCSIDNGRCSAGTQFSKRQRNEKK